MRPSRSALSLGALVYKVGSVPLTLSTSGGALIAGLFFGWLRSVRPTFGRIPSPTVWFMNSVGLNVFIAIVGISSGPKFIAGLQQLGFSLFLWGVVATTAAADPGDVSSASICSASTTPSCSELRAPARAPRPPRSA